MQKKNAGIWTLAIKIGSKLLALITKGAKFWLAAASAITYSYMFGWKFAIAIMIMLFVHESGHVWAMRKCGIPTKGFYFIPLLGGAAVPDRAFKSRSEEFYVAIMGPIWGLILAVGVGLLYMITGVALFAVIASWMALVNLFNLLPINPLDGGRMIKSITFSINNTLAIVMLCLGIFAMSILLIWFKIYLFAILLIVSLIELYFEYNRTDEIPKIPKKHIIFYFISYVLLGFLLYYVMYLTREVPGSDIANKILHG
jgi:Zn-dependent protease